MGGWLLRAAQGFTGRANSALAAGDPGMPLAEAVIRVRRWYAERDLPAMIAVPYPLGRPGDSDIDRFLGRYGWGVRPGPAVVMTAPAALVAKTRPTERVDLQPEPGKAWLDHYHYRGRPLPPVARQLLVSAPFQAFASIRREGGIVAIRPGRCGGRLGRADGGGGSSRPPAYRPRDRDHRRPGRCRCRRGCREPVSPGARTTRRPVRCTRAPDSPRHHGYHYRIAPSAG